MFFQENSPFFTEIPLNKNKLDTYLYAHTAENEPSGLSQNN